MKNPLTLDAFADWLSRQPADERYEFFCTDCAIGRYLRECGFPLKRLGVKMWVDTSDALHDLPKGFNAIAETAPHTYGAAAHRARTAIAA